MSRAKPVTRESSVKPPTVRMRSIMAALLAPRFASAGGPTHLALRRHPRRPLLEAAHGDFEARHAFLAAHHRFAALADRGEEGDKLAAQRLGIADRQVPHRIAAVRLEPEAFR